jgi:hypothetical protein
MLTQVPTAPYVSGLIERGRTKTLCEGAKLDHVLLIDEKPEFLATQIQHTYSQKVG